MSVALRTGTAFARFLVLLLGFTLFGTHVGRAIILWTVRGEPPWLLSLPLFAESMAVALVGGLMTVMAWKPRDSRIGLPEFACWLLAVVICAGGIAVAVVFKVWLDDADWIGASGVILIALYAAWMVLRRVAGSAKGASIDAEQRRS